MKSKLALVFGIVVMAFGAVSCSSDDSPSTRDNNKLVGKWSYTEEQALDGKGVLLETTIEDNGVCPQDVLEFLPGGILQSFFYNYSETATTCTPFIVEEAWKVEGTKLKIATLEEGKEIEIALTIKELSEKTLLLDISMSRDEAEDYPENTVTLRKVFKKK